MSWMIESCWEYPFKKWNFICDLCTIIYWREETVNRFVFITWTEFSHIIHVTLLTKKKTKIRNNKTNINTQILYSHPGDNPFYSNIDSMPDIRPRRKSIPLVSELVSVSFFFSLSFFLLFSCCWSEQSQIDSIIFPRKWQNNWKYFSIFWLRSINHPTEQAYTF